MGATDPLARPATVFTIGHSTRPLPEFLGLLAAHGVAAIADVRRFPGSRRNPAYGSDALAAALAADGLGYRWFPELGGRRKALPGSPNTAWRNGAFRGYADHMESEAFRAGFGKLVAFAAQQPAALLCAELLWWRCHRALIADALVAAGIPVAHILGPGKAAPHALRPPARLVAGRLAYTAEPAA
ncbi:MAG: DUF488 domain-containing protein [Burkholderiales bacterium]|nr:DUF488 domain-containing protein [Burkholderiales bacterium]